MEATEDAISRGWFGYGNWSAKYWFVGMEPGGAELVENVQLWEQANRAELLDLSVSLPGQKDWFGPESEVQHTWQKLIWLLLAYKGLEPTAAATIDYQRRLLGRPLGETALLELSPFAAKTNAIEVPRELGRSERVDFIRERMLLEKPEFVVFYSADVVYARAWAEIAGTRLVEGEPAIVGTTACVMTYHPNHEWGKAYWLEAARKLREARTR